MWDIVHVWWNGNDELRWWGNKFAIDYVFFYARAIEKLQCNQYSVTIHIHRYFFFAKTLNIMHYSNSFYWFELTKLLRIKSGDIFFQ